MGKKVTVYGKPDCCLCDQAKLVIERVRTEYPFQLEEVDITSDSELERKYRDRVPLIKIDDRLAFKYQVEEAELINRLGGIE